jgi:hypothetical protein
MARPAAPERWLTPTISIEPYPAQFSGPFVFAGALAGGGGLGIAMGAFNILQSGSFDAAAFFRPVAERRVTVVPFVANGESTTRKPTPSSRPAGGRGATRGPEAPRSTPKTGAVWENGNGPGRTGPCTS